MTKQLVRQFYVLRYSLVEDGQSRFDIEKLPQVKGEAILPALLKDRNFKLRNVDYRMFGFRTGNLTDHGLTDGTRFAFGRLAKRRNAVLGKLTPEDIVSVVQDDWVGLRVIVDTKEQNILVENDYKFGPVYQLERVVEAGLKRDIQKSFNHSIKIHVRTQRNAFWELVRSSKHVYRLEMNLISPNILDANAKAKESLTALKKMFNQSETKIILSNSNGTLKIPEDPIRNYVEYAESGEGRWSVTTEAGGRGTRPARHTSADSAVILSFDSQENGSDLLSDDGETIRNRNEYEEGVRAYLHQLPGF